MDSNKLLAHWCHCKNLGDVLINEMIFCTFWKNNFRKSKIECNGHVSYRIDLPSQRKPILYDKNP